MLGGDNQPIDVAFTFRAAPSRVAVGAAPTGRLSEISGYYCRIQPRRLLITGAAGAGKTVLAVEPMLGLLEKLEADEPVPVRMALAGWDTTRPLDAWMTGELADTYQLSLTTARRLIDRRCVLPVLDGLDEGTMSIEIRSSAARSACGQYACSGQSPPAQPVSLTATRSRKLRQIPDSNSVWTRLREVVVPLLRNRTSRSAAGFGPIGAAGSK
ncbi:hypothetical protein OHA84_01330 [Streptomyces sp. NBC_00513]|uniref:hypothetical protein n=1 Tax=unclassified Streptomyces TaxID=2593676 RepID=UPI0022502FEB|nr:hypothetical protein [Streptomyces sp. NBC_00424]MCX5079346.1 hypothetical protein [Streptomyces sp. NBC_00424]WUD39249.1 hypothetical protein OHA84_01330 [Streptomyces sp. NBC_00513]